MTPGRILKPSRPGPEEFWDRVRPERNGRDFKHCSKVGLFFFALKIHSNFQARTDPMAEIGLR